MTRTWEDVERAAYDEPIIMYHLLEHKQEGTSREDMLIRALLDMTEQKNEVCSIAIEYMSRRTAPSAISLAGALAMHAAADKGKGV